MGWNMQNNLLKWATWVFIPILGIGAVALFIAPEKSSPQQVSHPSAQGGEQASGLPAEIPPTSLDERTASPPSIEQVEPARQLPDTTSPPASPIPVPSSFPTPRAVDPSKEQMVEDRIYALLAKVDLGRSLSDLSDKKVQEYLNAIAPLLKEYYETGAYLTTEMIRGV
jgi:hypothetical protein